MHVILFFLKPAPLILSERAPFVFTEEMAVVMEGKKSDKFKEFEDYCTKAYNLVRKQGYFLINIFMMMLSAGRQIYMMGFLFIFGSKM